MSLLDLIHDLLASGGLVMPPLFALSFAVWLMLGWQTLVLLWQRCADTAAVEAFAAAPDREALPLPGRGWQSALCGAVAAPDATTRTLDLAVERTLQPLQMAPRVLPALINAATLLGLLGTVTGMIAVFEVLRRTGVGDPAGLASGIRQALISTQVGLVVAVPALFAERRLRRHILNLRQRLDETQLILRRHLPTAPPATAGAATAAAMSAKAEAAPCV